MTEHLKLRDLTPFAARYHLASNVRAQPTTPQEAKVLSIIEAEANSLAAKDVGLDENFQRLCESIERQSAHFRGEISAELAQSLNGLLQSLRQHSCCNCKAKDRQCTHNTETFIAVKDGGKCIEPLKKLFDALCGWVEGLWRDLPRRAGLQSVPVVFATTGRTFDHPQPIIQRFHVSGYARSLRDKNGEYTERGGYYTKVGLEIREDSFGWRQYSLLPYLLLHEILCHAFQSLDNPPLRPNAEPSDAWSEGWMDALAYELAKEWLKKHDKLPFMSRDEYRDAKREIRELHDARYPKALTAGGISHPGDGRKALHDVLDSYPDEYERLSQTRHPVTRFSLRLNAMTIPIEKRVRGLEKLRHLAKKDSTALHRAIGDFNAEANDVIALQSLERNLQ